MVTDGWRDVGRWWTGEPEASFLRLTVDGAACLELWRSGDGDWRIYKVYD